MKSGSQNRVAPGGDEEEMSEQTGGGAYLVRGAGQKPNAIPVEFADMRERLIRDHDGCFHTVYHNESQARQETFRRFADRIWVANRMRLNRLFHKWLEAYMYFNPDQGGVVHPKDEMSSTQFHIIEGKWRSMLYTVLDKAGYAMISEDELAEAASSRALGGINLIPPDPAAVEYELFYRGVMSKTKKLKSWRTWFRKTTVHYKEYDRLMVLYRIKAKPEDVQEERGVCGIKSSLLVRFVNMFSLGGEPVTPIVESDPQLWYMKIFKDVSSLDIDMMVPGSSINFTWFDVAMIWIPTLIGLASAIKTVVDIWGEQVTWIDWFVLVVLCIMPLSWGFKAYDSIKNKENQYMVHLGSIYMTQNLNNNQGVCGDLLEEAHEQENNETLLAYFFLWQGAQNADFKEKSVLDREVEAYLLKIMSTYDCDGDIDFDVTDALDKLVQMGICTRKVFPNGLQMFRVVSLEDASELINPVRISAFINSLGPQHGRGPCAMSDWREAFAPAPPGEKPVRYFANSVTGERRYQIPDDYIPLNFNISAGFGANSPMRLSTVANDRATQPDSFMVDNALQKGIPPQFPARPSSSPSGTVAPTGGLQQLPPLRRPLHSRG